jgi:hypothetical protein
MPLLLLGRPSAEMVTERLVYVAGHRSVSKGHMLTIPLGESVDDSNDCRPRTIVTLIFTRETFEERARFPAAFEAWSLHFVPDTFSNLHRVFNLDPVTP